MSSLPPYSTYRTDSKQMPYPQATSHGNILTFTPPGFPHQLNVKFPDSRLAVCEKCKKNFKTRDMCRVRNTHTTPPWTTAYICITIDDSCLDEHGRYVDKPMTVRMVQWQPYCVKKPFDAKTPVCAACKRTNRTRSFCRERHKHRQLPWCSVYVLLSTLEAADPSTVVAGQSLKLTTDESENGESKLPAIGDDSVQVKNEDTHYRSSDTICSDPNDRGDDVNEIADSRTYLAKVSCRSTSIHWLDLAEYDLHETMPFGAVAPLDMGYPMGMVGMPPHMLDPNQSASMSSYYQPNMAYAAQQHQNELKSRQQYFFQMQQQHQYPPAHNALAMQPPSHWPQQPMPYSMMGPPLQQGEPNLSGVTAGEAAAAAATQRAMAQLPPPSQLQQQQQQQAHWAAMYYQHGMMGFPNTQQHDSNGQHLINQSGVPEEFSHTPQESRHNVVVGNDEKDSAEDRSRLDQQPMMAAGTSDNNDSIENAEAYYAGATLDTARNDDEDGDDSDEEKTNDEKRSHKKFKIG